jgi:hypothetical protein
MAIQGSVPLVESSSVIDLFHQQVHHQVVQEAGDLFHRNAQVVTSISMTVQTRADFLCRQGWA